MGYSVKWVDEHLGITRDMLRYYEKEKLLPVAETRNPTNKYRDYSEEDIERIWGIKLLIGIGFSAKEIREFGSNPDFSFYEVMTGKVEQLEKRRDEILTYLGFAKTIQMTGRVPNATRVGSMKFDDFIEHSRQNWNAFNDPQGRRFMDAADTILDKPSEEWDASDVKCIMDIYGDIAPEEMAYIQTIGGYYRVIADMKPLGYSCDAVQTVVKSLYEYMLTYIEPEFKEKFTPLYFADRQVSSFIDSGFAAMNERNYGKDGCLFIAQAIATFGGYNLDA